MKIRPVFAWGLALALGCDVSSGVLPTVGNIEVSDNTEVLAAPSVCDGACDEPHCENVFRTALEHEAASEWCLADCQHEQVACLLDAADDYGGLCGQCELDAAVCRSGCP